MNGSALFYSGLIDYISRKFPQFSGYKQYVPQLYDAFTHLIHPAVYLEAIPAEVLKFPESESLRGTLKNIFVRNQERLCMPRHFGFREKSLQGMQYLWEVNDWWIDQIYARARRKI